MSELIVAGILETSVFPIEVDRTMGLNSWLYTWVQNLVCDNKYKQAEIVFFLIIFLSILKVNFCFVQQRLWVMDMSNQRSSRW